MPVASGSFSTHEEATTAKRKFFRAFNAESNVVRLSASKSGPVEKSVHLLMELPPEWRLTFQTNSLVDGSWLNCSLPATNGVVLPESVASERFRVSAEAPIKRQEYIPIFVGGQSNAELADYESSHRFTNVVFLTRELNFKHPLQFDPAQEDRPFQFSFSVEAAARLAALRGTQYMVIPVAVGGTAMSSWLPASNRFDRSTLFGDANFRRVVATPRPIEAIWYYGHESSAVPPDVDDYALLWKRLIAEFQREMGRTPVIYAQLAKSTSTKMQEQNFRVAEIQRMMESGQSAGTADHFMVVTFDLPLGDVLHLSGRANAELGRRFSLAMRERVFGENVNGTGPRLRSVSFHGPDKELVRIEFDREINEAVNEYDRQFSATSDSGGVEIVSVERDSTGRAVLIGLAPGTPLPVFVSYGARPADAPGQFLGNVIRDMDGLPAPAFGPIEVR